MATFHFTVDDAYNKANNEFGKDVRRLQLSAGALGLILLLGAVWFFLASTAPWRLVVLIGVGFLALFCLALVFILPKQVGGAQRLYDTYELVPAIIAEENPRDVVLMALVNLAVDPSARPIQGLALRTVTKVGSHDRTVGTRVPAVAVSGRRSLKDNQRWDEISPMPIAWATPDADTIRRAEREIPESLWRELERHLGRLDDVKATPMNLLAL